MAFRAIEACRRAKRCLRTLRRMALHAIVNVGNQYLAVIEWRLRRGIGGKRPRMTVAAVRPGFMSPMIKARMLEPARW